MNITYAEALNLALVHEMESDPSVFVFGLDVDDHKAIFGSTKGLVEKFGARRCFGTPLSEDAMTGVAIGAAISGLRPVHVHIRADFLLLCMNQLVNMASNMSYMSGGKLSVPLVVRAVIGRGWGQGPQHSKSMHGMFAHFPGLKVMMPTTPQDAYSMLRAAIRDPNPVIFLEHRWLYDIAGEVNVDAGSGDAPVIRRNGDDITIVSTSWMTVEALKAAEILIKRGISCEVIDIRKISPLYDETVIFSVRKTKYCLIIDCDWIEYGFSAEMAATVASECFGDLLVPVARVGFWPVPCPTTRSLENLFYPSARDIITEVEEMLNISETDLSTEEFYSHENRFKGPF